MMLIAQISDLHIKANRRFAYGKVDTASALEACIDQLNRLTPRPDLVLATGDLVDSGSDAEYATLRSLLAGLELPLYLLPGNHDDRAGLRRAFPEATYLPADGFLNYVIEDLPLRLVALDSLDPGHGHGRLCSARLDWLAATLAARPDAPTLVALHHPPFTTGIGFMDRLGLVEGGDRLRSIIAAHPQIERVLCGHLHRPITVRWAGTVAATCPSPAHQVALDLADSGAGFKLEPPGLLLHLWRGGSLISHLVPLGDYGPIYPFNDPSGKMID